MTLKVILHCEMEHKTWRNIVGALRNNPRPYFYFLDRAHLLVTQHTFIWLGSVIWLLIIRTFAAVKIHFLTMTAPPAPPCKWYIKTCQEKALSGAIWPPLKPSYDAPGQPVDAHALIIMQFTQTTKTVFTSNFLWQIHIYICSHTHRGYTEYECYCCGL